MSGSVRSSPICWFDQLSSEDQFDDTSNDGGEECHENKDGNATPDHRFPNADVEIRLPVSDTDAPPTYLHFRIGVLDMDTACPDGNLFALVSWDID